jgi:glycosyltransferase involved in cell wall biosynthesis
MFGAWWAATRSTPRGVPVIASEHNRLTWPMGDYSAEATAAASRVERFHVVPSREESWSQSAVTALAPGVPVVATAVDALPRTLGGRRGVLVQPDPAALAAGIQSVLDGAADIDVAGARHYAALFQPAQIGSDYFAVYQRVLSQRSRSSGAAV